MARLAANDIRFTPVIAPSRRGRHFLPEWTQVRKRDEGWRGQGEGVKEEKRESQKKKVNKN